MEIQQGYSYHIKDGFLVTKIITTDYNNVSYAYDIKIENVRITNIKSYESYGDAERIAEMCSMQIPYNTDILVSDVKE